MKHVTRMVLTAGITAAAALSVGAGAASAVPRTAPTAVQQVASGHDDPDELQFYDWYGSKSACKKAGNKGEQRDEWYDFSCDQGRGKHRYEWGLYIAMDDEDRHGGGDDD
ncbi:hypothetical protein [Actinoplanes teichomyceticus]|uniref:Uncharacterized protein n=1 Tax=Actinoplanes teichomyceticus TaxID=1867 RepID=A0A561WLE5_ACTTI|nr:hypothetical protein [Actinoplanes teichomyceticus]TWG24665.1 hypothetical protein FHX34_1021225 [Actinoplanes teichomyceticus]GIF14672.1 hypothetical protein Ate01nite_47040 [Actinoplanes teichomyceticus]